MKYSALFVMKYFILTLIYFSMYNRINKRYFSFLFLIALKKEDIIL